MTAKLLINAWKSNKTCLIDLVCAYMRVVYNDILQFDSNQIRLIHFRLFCWIFVLCFEPNNLNISFCFYFLILNIQMKRKITQTAFAIFLIIECSCIHNALSRKLISSTIRVSSTESPLAPAFNSQFNLNSTTSEKTWVNSNEWHIQLN